MVRDSGDQKRSRRRTRERRERGEMLCVLRDGRETEVRQGTHSAENMAIWTSSSFLLLFWSPLTRTTVFIKFTYLSTHLFNFKFRNILYKLKGNKYTTIYEQREHLNKLKYDNVITCIFN